MQIEQTGLQDCLIVIPQKFGDERGFFMETYSKRKIEAYGISMEFVQDNHSLSAEIGTLRGLHYQAPPSAQDKLVRVTQGRVIDVAVDVRQGSPTYMRSISVELSAQNGKQLFIPKGFLHGFVTLEENTEFLYKVSDYYDAQTDGSILWNDADLAVNWHFPDDVRLSEKDQNAPKFRDWKNPFIYGENC